MESIEEKNSFACSWGRRPVLHLANVIFIVSRVIILFITDQYIAVLVITCLGSTFYPVGIRVAYALGKK